MSIVTVSFKHRGIGLVHLLVWSGIFLLALVSTIGLFSENIRNLKGAYIRTQITLFSQSILEDMRTQIDLKNMDDRERRDIIEKYKNELITSSTSWSKNASQLCIGTHECDPDEMVQYYKSLWKQYIDSLSEGGRHVEVKIDIVLPRLPTSVTTPLDYMQITITSKWENSKGEYTLRTLL